MQTLKNLSSRPTTSLTSKSPLHRTQSLEKELSHAQAEASRCQQQLQLTLNERAALDERLAELQAALESARLETARAADLERRGRQERDQERAAQERLMAELAGELQETQRSAHLRLKTETDEAGRVRLQQDRLETELRRLRTRIKVRRAGGGGERSWGVFVGGGGSVWRNRCFGRVLRVSLALGDAKM